MCKILISFVVLCIVFVASCRMVTDTTPESLESSSQQTDTVRTEDQKADEAYYKELRKETIGGMPYEWYAQSGLVIHDRFSDPKVIELCEAIQRKDIAAIELLIKGGVGVNARGKGDVTPLFWALYAGKEVFNLLLKNGADPNIQLSEPIGGDMVGEFITFGGGWTGESVTLLTGEMFYPDHFISVMNHGGNPNLINKSTRDSLLYHVLATPCQNKYDRVKLLIERGADVNYVDEVSGTTHLVKSAISGQYDITLLLLESGADYSCVREGRTVAHTLALDYDEMMADKTPRGDKYREIVKWLEDKGVSVERAKKEREEWEYLPKILKGDALLRWQEYRRTTTNVEGSKDHKVIEYRVWHNIEGGELPGKHQFLTWRKWTERGLVVLEVGEPKERLFDRDNIALKYLCPEDQECVKKLFAEKMAEEFKKCKVRQWNTNDGTFSAEAQPVRLEGENIVLKRQDTGEEIILPLENLSESDTHYLDSLTQLPPEIE